MFISYLISSFISYLIFPISLILSRIMQNINMSDKEQEVTELIEQQQDNASSGMVKQFQKIGNYR